MKSRHLISLVVVALLLSEIQVGLACLGKQSPPRLWQNGTDLSWKRLLAGIFLLKLLPHWQEQTIFV